MHLCIQVHYGTWECLAPPAAPLPRWPRLYPGSGPPGAGAAESRSRLTSEVADASLDEIKRGYTESAQTYTFRCCGHQVEKGVIDPVGDRLYRAGRYMRHHVAEARGSVFAYLIGLDKLQTSGERGDNLPRELEDDDDGGQ